MFETQGKALRAISNWTCLVDAFNLMTEHGVEPSRRYGLAPLK
jgi:hypothetical protein